MLEVTKEVRSKYEEFKPYLPLINDLRNPSLKKRHWKKIEEIIGKDLENDVNITL